VQDKGRSRGRSVIAILIAIAIIAVFATTAMAASSPAYHSESSTTTELSGQSNLTLDLGFGTLACTSSSLAGSMSGLSAQSVSFLPTIAGCTYFGQSLPVASNGCLLKLGQPSGSGPQFGVPGVNIECPEGKSIIFKGTSCSVSIGSQALTSYSIIESAGTSPATERLHLAFGHITYTSNGGVCGTKGTRSTGTLEGEFGLRGYSGGKQVGIFVG
jgi:hypothetical protein